MTKYGLPLVHPGELLAEEIQALGMSANGFAAALGVPTNRITTIIKGQRGITADTALRLARYLGTSAELWMNLQRNYDLRKAEGRIGTTIERQITPRAA